MADEQGDKNPTVAYVPFKTFLSALDTLGNGLPHVIDRTVWPSFSGVMQSQVLGAFRFLKLIDSDDKPTAILEALIEAKDARKEILRTVIEEGYAPLLKKDLTKMSVGNFEEAMRDYSVTGETLRKACSFFLQAAKYCGVPLSTYLQRQTRNVSTTRKRRGPTANNQAKAESGLEGEDGPEVVTPTGSPTKTIRLDNGISLSLSTSADTFQMTTRDRKFVFELLEQMENYTTSRSDEF